MDAGPWLAVPPDGYGGLENVVATLTTELRRRGHEVVLATVGESRLPSDGRVSAFAQGQFGRLADSYADAAGVATTHALAVVDEVRRQASAGTPFDLVHTHLQVVGPALLAALGPEAPPALHTLHWDLHRNAEFYAAFDGRDRVFFAGVSRSQVARGPAALRRQTLGAVPLAVPLPAGPPLPRTARADFVLVLSRLCAAKGVDTAVRACRAAGIPLVLAGPVGPYRDRAELDAALADPARTGPEHPDVAWFTEHVAPYVDGDRVRWVGTVSGPAKEDLLRRARAVLTPVRWPEPGGTAVCEALAAGTPVVAMALGCLPSLVDDGVTGFLAADEVGFTAALSRLDELDPEACAADARRRFSPAVMADGYERLYAQVLRQAATAGRRPPRSVPAYRG
ncbi:glycosyltransferase family 4 protein [Modestobacter versicolor]|nr:glycosyltransferase family 4 protein [Modestobacter versicolor]